MRLKPQTLDMQQPVQTIAAPYSELEDVEDLLTTFLGHAVTQLQMVVGF